MRYLFLFFTLCLFAAGLRVFDEGTAIETVSETTANVGMAVPDLDGDGWPDLVAARSDAPSLISFSRPGAK